MRSTNNHNSTKILALWVGASALLLPFLSSTTTILEAAAAFSSSSPAGVVVVGGGAGSNEKIRTQQRQRVRREEVVGAPSTTATSLEAHRTQGRREFFVGTASAAAAFAVAGLVVPDTGGGGGGVAAAAEIDYSKVQDLLKGTDGFSGQQVYRAEGARPTYLTEPTEEFKQNEAKTSAFKREQLERKKSFLAVLEKLETDPNNEAYVALCLYFSLHRVVGIFISFCFSCLVSSSRSTSVVVRSLLFPVSSSDPRDVYSALVSDLDKMVDLVKQQRGLPLGITKDELVKRVRRRKAKRYWPTNVEIA